MKIIIPDWPAPSHIKAFTSTRSSEDDTPQLIEKDKNFLKETLKLPGEPCWLKQVHGTDLLHLEKPLTNPVEADASTTQTPNVICSILTADCLPLLICNKKGTLVAAVHAGWKGLAANIIEKTLKQLSDSPKNLLVWLGPAIGPDAFEIGEDVKTALCTQAEDDSAFHALKKEGKYLCDLYQLARLRLNKLGVQSVFGGKFCTYTQNSLFYSYRRNKQTGRIINLIYMTSC
ncbi:MAG: hypothetical protein A3G71_03450 [Gammaproteobacteria bacterium RIFCSPLOWO2_12_FULL_38_14]|nr:MAG: hypothetical protein A3G71_03450 [Gammaproteobacteria bacterium RIFCSPLOWO2_12_FULL_38_14]